MLLVPFWDRHTDHRVVLDAALVAARPFGDHSSITLIAAYEVLSSTHLNVAGLEPQFTPNWIVDISDFVEEKLAMIRLCPSQMRPYPHPRSVEAVRALAQFRGTSVGVAYGEAFYLIRLSATP